MKILFIGGTGVLSSACTHGVCARGDDLTLLNRGLTSRPISAQTRLLRADYRDRDQTRQLLKSHQFDIVVNWIAFTPEDVEFDMSCFRGRVAQYVFISSASAYQKPPRKLPVTENTPLDNPFWEYSRQKIACEQRLQQAYQAQGFPVTIVRPSHTYDRTMIPIHGGYTIIDRMRKGKKVVIHGDGTSLWTLTHNLDFAQGFIGLLGNQKAVGETFHITSDEFPMWDQICEWLARAAGVEPKIVHIPSEFITRFDPDWGDSLLGDKRYSMIFDNSKIKKFVPDFKPEISFRDGAKEIVQWYDENSNRQVVNNDYNKLLDRMIVSFESLSAKL